MQSANEATNIDRFYEAIANMEAQLVAMYQDQSDLGIDLGEAKDTIESMENQLVELYREKEHSGEAGTQALQDSLESMEHQLVELYKQQESENDSQEIIENLENQLRSLELKLQSANGDTALYETVENLEQQLIGLYEEKEHLMEQPGGDVMTKIMSLLQENINLTKENAQLRYDVARHQRDLVDTKAKLKQWSGTLLEAAFKA